MSPSDNKLEVNKLALTMHGNVTNVHVTINYVVIMDRVRDKG